MKPPIVSVNLIIGHDLASQDEDHKARVDEDQKAGVMAFHLFEE